MAKNAQLQLLGQKIREARKAQKLTQDDVAFKAGLSRSYYSGIERGERNVAAINLIKIAFHLDVEVGALFPPTSKLKKYITS